MYTGDYPSPYAVYLFVQCYYHLCDVLLIRVVCYSDLCAIMCGLLAHSVGHRGIGGQPACGGGAPARAPHAGRAVQPLGSLEHAYPFKGQTCSLQVAA